MDLSFLYIFISLVAPVLLIICLNLILPSNKFHNNQPLPPGNTGILAYVGETLRFAIMGKNGTPEKFLLDRMKKFSNQVFKTSLLGQKTAVFCGASGNKFLFTNENKLVALSWPNGSKKLFPHSGETIAELTETSMRFRRILHGVFNPDAMQSYVGILDILTKDHLTNHWDVGDGQLSVLPQLKQFSFTVSCKMFLNINTDLSSDKMKDLANKFELVAAAVFSVPINFPGTALNRGIRATNFVREELLKIIRQRTNNDPKLTAVDYLSTLLKSTDENGKKMSELEISDHLLVSLVGSRDSTTSAITSTIKYLAEYPLVYDEVLKEQRSIAREKPEGEMLNWKDLQKMKYTWDVVCEVLRLFPPVQGNFREALHDFTYSNFFIPKGWKLYWSPHTTHRNPKYFPQPEKFDPSRFQGRGFTPYAYVPFGGGSRICPGKDIIRLVILIFIYNVVGKFRWENMVPDEKMVILPFPLPEKGLPVRLIPH